MASIRDDNPDIKSFDVQLADGRTLSVDASSEESARRLAREQGGNVGVLSVEQNDNPDGDPDDRDGIADVTPLEGNAGGGTAPLPHPTDERDGPTFVDVPDHNEADADPASAGATGPAPASADEAGIDADPSGTVDATRAQPNAYDEA